ncbi:MAG: carotenoid oxygenase family protein [Alphaproteobacteria bacterium]
MDGTSNPATAANWAFQGNFAPVGSEDDFVLPVTGDIPRELNGTLFRIGPNPRFAPRDAGHHWFLGDGMVHALGIEDGQVHYRNRWVRTPRWNLEDAAGRALFGSWGNPMTTDPAARGTDGGVANTNIVWHAGRLLALEEAHRPFALDPATVASDGYLTLGDGTVKRFTAHPKIDPVTGEMLFFAYSTGEEMFSAEMSYGVVGPDGALVRHDRFAAPYCSMVHDLIATERHVLFPVLPLTGSRERAMRGLPAWAWEPGKGAYLGVMARDAGVETIRWIEMDPCYVFHAMNAWDAGLTIVADVVEYPVAPLFPNADGSPGIGAEGRLVRWTIDLATGRVDRQPIDDAAAEFPRIDDRRAGLPHRHGFLIADTGTAPEGRQGTIAHHDAVTLRRTDHVLPPGDSASEMVFVPRSPTAAEGDGWLVGVVHRGAADRADLVVLDATDVARGPVASARMPRRIPFGIHGNWVPRVG